MHEIRIAPIAVSGSCVRFRWSVEPGTTLYKQESFTLDFGGVLDPHTLPERVWWTVALLSLHPHWNLLRPCRVIFPVTLPEGEIEFWERMLDSERFCLEAFRDGTDLARTIEIACEGPALNQGKLAPTSERCAAAFSGGKESLMQAGLLCELTERPILVNTQSEMPPMIDHSTLRRAYVLEEISRRRDCEVVVVKSDYRAGWDNLYPPKLGYRQNLNELVDCYFYLANLFVVTAARGLRTMCLGCEFETHQIGKLYDGRFAHYYFMMGPTALGALARYFEQSGIEFGSPLFPLSQIQIEGLLWRRYADIADLQNSCFGMDRPEDGYCNRCRKCLRIALFMLGMDIDPTRLGLDVSTIFIYQTGWDPQAPPMTMTLPYATQRIDLNRARRYFRAENWKQRMGLEEPRAFSNLKNLIALYRDADSVWAEQYRPQLLRYVPPSLRHHAGEIYAREWQTLDPTDYAAEFAEMDAEIEWISAPLGKVDVK